MNREPCYATHTRAGLVTNKPDGDYREPPIAARAVCARQACQRAAKAWVRERTGEPGVFVGDVPR